MDTLRIVSNNYNGQSAVITYYPDTGGTINLGTQVLPYDYVTTYYYGTYSLFFPSFGSTCTLYVEDESGNFLLQENGDYIFQENYYKIIIESNPIPTLSVTPSLTPSETPTPSITPSLTPTPSITPSLTPSETPTPSLTPSITPSETPTPSLTPSETPTPSLTPTTSQNDIVQNGLIMYWDIQNTSSYGGSGTIITDLKGNSNGTLTGTIPFTSGTPSSGDPNYLEIQGSSSEYISTNTDLNPFLSPINTGTEISHFIWVYPTTNGIIVNEEGSTTPSQFWFDSQVEIVSNNLLLRVWNLSPPYITSNISLVFNTWNYIGLTYNSDTTLTAYLNGVSVGTTNLSRLTPYNNGSGRALHYSLGANNPTNMGNGTGSTFRFGAFHVYNRALTSGEVNSNYNITKNSYLLPPSTTPTPSITPSFTPSISITPSETPTPSITPSISITPSETPTIFTTPSLTPSVTPSFTPSATPTPSEIDTNGLILYVNFSNTSSYSGSGASVFDLSPNGYTGTLNNTYTYNSTTKTMNFSTSSGYIGWGTGASLVRSASVMTIGILIRPISIPWGNSGFRWSCPLSIDNFNVGPSARKFTMYFYNPSNNTSVATNLVFDFFDGIGGGAGLTKSSSNWLNQDLYVVATCESGTNNAKLYINGVLEHTINGITPNTNPSNSAPLNTGRIGTGFDGQIGESNLYSIHMYNRILSEAEIVSNYNILKNQFGI